MKRVYVLAEGQTEETFLRQVLAPHLQPLGIAIFPILVTTKRVKAGGKFRGGISSFGKLAGDLRKLLPDRSAAAITTMIDFYGLPKDFPGRDTLPESGSCYHRVEHLEKAWAKEVDDGRFWPYLSLHEFEALLLVSPEDIARALSLEALTAKTLEALRRAVPSPEEINDGDDTHPAARILKIAPRYRKAFHGPLVTSRIGLAPLRAACPHFHGWLQRLETVAQR